MREELDLHKFAWGNCDAKKYKRGGNKDKDGKFRQQMRYLTLPFI